VSTIMVIGMMLFTFALEEALGLDKVLIGRTRRSLPVFPRFIAGAWDQCAKARKPAGPLMGAGDE
jgi:hypothetical protein